jgi:hypothetical protein
MRSCGTSSLGRAIFNGFDSFLRQCHDWSGIVAVCVAVRMYRVPVQAGLQDDTPSKENEKLDYSLHPRLRDDAGK